MGADHYDLNGMPAFEMQGGSVSATNTFGANGLVSRDSTSNGDVLYTFDNKGNTCEELTSAGGNAACHGSEAFGLQNSSTYTDPFQGFGAQWGYYYDHETNFSLLGHRYYDPAWGRFINQDPTGFTGGINLYRYGLNNPSRFSDPTGYETFQQYLEGVQALPGQIAPHGNTLNQWPSTLYGLYTENGGFLKWGISINPADRYSNIYLQSLGNARLEPLFSAPRDELAPLEKYLVSEAPGPLNLERWAGTGSNTFQMHDLPDEIQQAACDAHEGISGFFQSIGDGIQNGTEAVGGALEGLGENVVQIVESGPIPPP